MFDFNGDGDVDAEEFDQVAHLLRQNTTHGSRHRDTTGNSYKVENILSWLQFLIELVIINLLLLFLNKQGVNSALSTFFFGPNRDQKLTIERFVEFQQQLQREILTLEVHD